MMHRYLKMLSVSAVLLLMLVSTGCASPKIVQDAKPGYSLKGYSSYQWRQFSADTLRVDQQWIQATLEQALAEQGLTRKEKGAELLLDLSVLLQEVQGGNTSVGIGIGLPVGRHGSIGLGTSNLKSSAKLRGRVILDISASSDLQLLWRGSASEIATSQFNFPHGAALQKTLYALVANLPR